MMSKNSWRSGVSSDLRMLSRRSVLRLSLASACVLMLVQSVARADDDHRVTLLEENDSLYTDYDRHYSQGLRLSDLTPDISPESAANRLFDLAGGALPIFSQDKMGAATPRRLGLFLGHSIFTPENKALKPPDLSDRPYGAWLYVGGSLLQESHGNMLENLEISLGVVGPSAVGKLVQNDFHQFVGVTPSRGWSKEIHNEPGVVLTYERLWRVSLLGDQSAGLDVVPQLGATVGNIFTYGGAGALLRFGKNLQVDYGGVRIRPALSGTDYFNAGRLDGALGYSIFAGAHGRVVGQNIFLDGSAFHQDPSVDKKPLVADLQAGISLFWSSRLQVNFSAVHRTREFEGQRSPDVIGTASVAFSM
jgi:lipid A 3-O-deacylase